ncbi:MAG: GAF domain-containing protein [Verrucomicrobia bacterium]|nr:GAF domain-containing protein [Verrucomicrobiota bacterium]MBS0646444.1 GAF domain-containing protein [Verrucomicrobiota bacterium]
MVVSLLDRERRLNEIGIALSKEPHIMHLLELILESAAELTQADGATIYTVIEKKALKFQIFRTRSLHFKLGGKEGEPIPFADIPLYHEDGSLDDRFTVTYAVNHRISVNIKDAYQEEGFDFSSTKIFDQKTGYRTRSVLAIPIFNHEGDAIALLQLINPIEGGCFSTDDQQLAESLASQAGIALSNQQLIHNLRALFDSFTRILAHVIDEKSPITGHHAARVPEITNLIAAAVNASGYAKLSDAEVYELQTAAWLHDCGKIITPTYILEKRNKLEETIDGILLVDRQLDLQIKDLEIALLKGEIDQQTFLGKTNEVELTREFLHTCNHSSVTEEQQEKLKKLQDLGWITESQLERLRIAKGNLTEAERKIMQDHVVMTIKILSKLTYPKELSQVPMIAGAHHEHLNGHGYPYGLVAEQLPLRCRILAIADVFEALSAPDRPYKEKFPLSKVLSIMQKMCEEGHLDAALFKTFVDQKVYLTYAKRFLSPEQIDMS